MEWFRAKREKNLKVFCGNFRGNFENIATVILKRPR